MARVCKRCLEEKKAGEFYLNPDYKDGRDGVCKACRLKRAKELWALKPVPPAKWFILD